MASPTYTPKFSPRGNTFSAGFSHRGTPFSDKYPPRAGTALTWEDANTNWADETRTWDEISRTRTQYTPKYT